MTTKTFGYIRVSTTDQNTARQEAKMKALGIDERDIYIDHASGKDFNRPQYQNMKSRLRAGDLVYVDALDRLGRNYEAIISEWKEITRKINADIVVLENATLFDSRKFKAMNSEDSQLGSLMEDQFLSLLSYVADQERKKILKRQKEGIAAARKAGKHLGRPAINLETLSKEQREILETNFEKWRAKEIKGVEFMEMLGLKKNTFYKVIKEYVK
ncbi:recombinase family protein [Kurthia huakuii]|uniref:recombinase family protein n=1 Tax=Kurthia huakuii TaxID=1421019 RepID=UPI000497E5B0|nr:recombinase family protein [Kurthia huakuii]MBM7700917.1 DNA invertase Pin-like site-specific DNA recombinase [Kurthia huakuii]